MLISVLNVHVSQNLQDTVTSLETTRAVTTLINIVQANQNIYVTRPKILNHYFSQYADLFFIIINYIIHVPVSIHVGINTASVLQPWGGGGVVLPYMGYIGMCCRIEYGF